MPINMELLNRLAREAYSSAAANHEHDPSYRALPSKCDHCTSTLDRTTPLTVEEQNERPNELVLLRCMHTVCMACLLHVRSEKEFREVPDWVCSKCSTCTDIVALLGEKNFCHPLDPETALKTFQETVRPKITTLVEEDNPRLTRLRRLRDEDPNRELYCDICTSPGTNEGLHSPSTAANRPSPSTEAAYYCIDCGQFLCEGCHTFHKRFKGMATHEYVSPSKALRLEFVQEPPLCPQHLGKQKLLFSSFFRPDLFSLFLFLLGRRQTLVLGAKCEVMGCTECLEAWKIMGQGTVNVVDPTSHETLASKVTGYLAGASAMVTKYFPGKLEPAITAVKQVVETLDEKTKKAHEDVDAAKQEMITQIDKWIDRFHGQVDANRQAQLGLLLGQISDLQTAMCLCHEMKTALAEVVVGDSGGDTVTTTAKNLRTKTASGVIELIDPATRTLNHQLTRLKPIVDGDIGVSIFPGEIFRGLEADHGITSDLPDPSLLSCALYPDSNTKGQVTPSLFSWLFQEIILFFFVQQSYLTRYSWEVRRPREKGLVLLLTLKPNGRQTDITFTQERIRNFSKVTLKAAHGGCHDVPKGVDQLVITEFTSSGHVYAQESFQRGNSTAPPPSSLFWLRFNVPDVPGRYRVEYQLMVLFFFFLLLADSLQNSRFLQGQVCEFVRPTYLTPTCPAGNCPEYLDLGMQINKGHLRTFARDAEIPENEDADADERRKDEDKVVRIDHLLCANYDYDSDEDDENDEYHLWDNASKTWGNYSRTGAEEWLNRSSADRPHDQVHFSDMQGLVFDNGRKDMFALFLREGADDEDDMVLMPRIYTFNGRNEHRSDCKLEGLPYISDPQDGARPVYMTLLKNPSSGQEIVFHLPESRRFVKCWPGFKSRLKLGESDDLELTPELALPGPDIMPDKDIVMEEMVIIPANPPQVVAVWSAKDGDQKTRHVLVHNLNTGALIHEVTCLRGKLGSRNNLLALDPHGNPMIFCGQDNTLRVFAVDDNGGDQPLHEVVIDPAKVYHKALKDAFDYDDHTFSVTAMCFDLRGNLVLGLEALPTEMAEEQKPHALGVIFRRDHDSASWPRVVGDIVEGITMPKIADLPVITDSDDEEEDGTDL